jgi:hypothetical protein
VFQAINLNTTANYSSLNATDAGSGVAKPVYVAPKNTAGAVQNDTLVMIASGATASIVGTFCIQGTGV